MTNYDRIKLTKAGFTLLRIHNDELKITFMTGSHSWATYNKYPTNAAMQREIKRINDEEPKKIFE